VMKIFVLALLTMAITAQDFTPEGNLLYPVDYREWPFLSSGLGMTYGPTAAAAREGAPLFDNVFVNPASYREFLKTGKWANGTVFVLEIRKSQGHGSINKDGQYQIGLTGFETEVKNAQGEWNFYDFAVQDGRPPKSGKLLPVTASCYACHAKNTAVENTFVQFYPQLMEVAQQKGTVKKGYVP